MAGKMQQPGLELAAPTLKVKCLGIEFAGDDERREHFRGRLREYLADPTFRATPGFPQGSDEAIIRMSDPPFYTACPNPFLPEIMAHIGKPYDPSVAYARAPLAIDVSVGKTDPLYKAHGYHTKVPHQAIVPSILHYTQPGDVVLDAFSGSGMTALAAQFCGVAPPTFRQSLESDWKLLGRDAPEWGARYAIASDLSPAASFIAANYNIPFDIAEFASAGSAVLQAVKDEIGWMYETTAEDGSGSYLIDYVVWSEVFACAACTHPIVFATAERNEEGEGRAKLRCPACAAEAKKEDLGPKPNQRVEAVRLS